METLHISDFDSAHSLLEAAVIRACSVDTHNTPVVVDCGPVMISALYGVPHFVSICGEEITAARAIELIEGREPGRQYVIGEIMLDDSISVESTSSPYREWDLERVKEANAEWECKKHFALFELVRVADYNS